MKKTAGIFLLCTMVFTLAACGQSQESPASAGAESSSAAGRDRNSKIRSQGTDGRESGIWDFALDAKDMEKIKALDTGSPSMLDTRKISEVKRVYDYLNNPVLTSL